MQTNPVLQVKPGTWQSTVHTAHNSLNKVLTNQIAGPVGAWLINEECLYSLLCNNEFWSVLLQSMWCQELGYGK